MVLILYCLYGFNFCILSDLDFLIILMCERKNIFIDMMYLFVLRYREEKYNDILVKYKVVNCDW